MEAIKKYRKKFMLIVSILLGILITVLGGGKLLIYLLIFASGLIIGIKYLALKRLYDDYKLSLRVNSIITGSKQIEEIRLENDRLKLEIRTMSDRLNLHQAAASTKRFTPGGVSFGNNDNNRTAWLRENE